jgi:predicted amidohydrolase YtcJ
MTGLQAAVTRRGPSGVIHGPEESVSVPEAIRMYTASGAFLSREEQIKGTLEAGKLADMIVLDADPLSIAAADLMKAQVDLTILGGNVVYERKDR